MLVNKRALKICSCFQTRIKKLIKSCCNCNFRMVRISLALIFVEYIFSLNGIGKEIVDSLNNLDMPVVMGSVLIISIVFVVVNIMVDIIWFLTLESD